MHAYCVYYLTIKTILTLLDAETDCIKGIVHQLDMYTLYEAVSYTDYHGTCHKLNRLRLEEKIIYLY